MFINNFLKLIFYSLKIYFYRLIFKFQQSFNFEIKWEDLIFNLTSNMSINPI